MYNANTKTVQVSFLNNLSSLLENFDVTLEKNLILAGVHAKRGKTCHQKKKSLAKLIQLKESYDLCDLWRIRNPVTSTFTFRKKHCTGFIQRRRDYVFISNSLQAFVNDTSILTSLSTAHSPVYLSLLKEDKHTKGNGFWKFYSSLIKDHMYVSEIKYLASSFLPNDICSMNVQLNWELLKYKIRKLLLIMQNAKHKKKENNNYI